jgi:hypothetical protein
MVHVVEGTDSSTTAAHAFAEANEVAESTAFELELNIEKYGIDRNRKRKTQMNHTCSTQAMELS